MAVTVFVWSMLTHPGHRAGHAAVQVQNTYISWWPEEGRSDMMHFGDNGRIAAFAGPSFSHSLKEDRFDEGRPPTYVSAPLKCLDEAKILAWWGELRPKNRQCKLSYSSQENTHYNLTRMSCATVAYKALEVGGSIKLIGEIHTGMANALKAAAQKLGGPVIGVVAQNIIGNAISPNDIRAYAEKLTKYQASFKKQ